MYCYGVAANSAHLTDGSVEVDTLWPPHSTTKYISELTPAATAVVWHEGNFYLVDPAILTKPEEQVHSKNIDGYKESWDASSSRMPIFPPTTTALHVNHVSIPVTDDSSFFNLISGWLHLKITEPLRPPEDHGADMGSGADMAVGDDLTDRRSKDLKAAGYHHKKAKQQLKHLEQAIRSGSMSMAERKASGGQAITDFKEQMGIATAIWDSIPQRGKSKPGSVTIPTFKEFEELERQYFKQISKQGEGESAEDDKAAKAKKDKEKAEAKAVAEKEKAARLDAEIKVKEMEMEKQRVEMEKQRVEMEKSSATATH